MQTYELLCVLPGTLAENEVEPVAVSVKTLITERGGAISSFDDLGKSRLSYPMKHIRYGYFRLCRFDAEQKQVNDIEKRLQMMNEVLRVFLVKLKPKNACMNTIQFAPAPQSMERAENAPIAAQAPALSLPEEMMPQPAQAPSYEKQEDKRIKLEDIDKKLDEILEKDIADQL